MATSKNKLAQDATIKGLGALSYRQTLTETGYTSELYLGKQVYYSESRSHPTEAKADEDAAEAALRCLQLEEAYADADVAVQLCLSLQQLNLGKTHSLNRTDDNSSAAAAPTCFAMKANISGSKGSLNGNSKSRCNELLSQVGSPPANYSVVSLTSCGLDSRFQATVNFRLNCVAKSEEEVNGKKPAEHKAAEQALKLLKVPLQGASAKSMLNEWAQTKRVQVPRYHAYTAGQSPGVYCAVVYNASLPVKNVSFDLKGDVCASKNEAEQSAAERVIALIDGLQLTGTVHHQQDGSSVLKTPPKPVAQVNVIRSVSRGGEAENCYDVLCRHCQKLRLPVPTALTRPSANGEDECVINMSYRFSETPQRPHTTKKEAEKAVAQYVLTTAFPLLTTPEADQCKNRLQEICQKRSATAAIPRYETVRTDAGSLFTSTVTVELEFSLKCGKEHKTAKHMVAKKILGLLSING